MKRILVIDDDDTFRVMLGKLFRNAGYEVTVAENGKEAIRRQEANPADLIVTDLIMPDQEGLETIMAIRKSYPATKIIAMSGGGLLQPGRYLELAENLGAQRTFTKPFKNTEILQAANELLKE